MKKKLSIVLAIMLTFIFTAFGLYSMNKAYAEENEDYVVGKDNLNGTEENSAKIGDVLKLPEKGWKRYDDRDSRIRYLGNDWTAWDADKQNYKGTAYILQQGLSSDIISNSSVKFKFSGSKFRFITCRYNEHTSTLRIVIDGIENIVNIQGDDLHEMIAFEKLDLDEGVHDVKIYSGDGIRFAIDAFDIDESGKFLPYDVQTESITLDKTAIDLLEGNTDKLTATVLPENAVNKKVVWSSSDETIATVDQEGNVSAIKVGQADITAKVDGTNLSATCKVIVTEKEPEPQPTPGKAILSISLVDGKTKDYDISMEEVEKFINWYETKASSTYKFDKNISPYKSVKEYIVHDKITSFEVREYE